MPPPAGRVEHDRRRDEGIATARQRGRRRRDPARRRPPEGRRPLPREAALSELYEADAVVIGTGAGGGPTAAALAEAGLRVVVLEAGARYDARDFTGVEGDLFFRLGRFTATGDGSLNLYAGQCVGGSTVVNDALCWRTPPEILRGWREDHGVELGLDDLDPFLDHAWEDVGAHVMGRSHLNRNAHALERGAKRLGWASEPMARNVRGCANLGLCNFGCPSNAKQSTLLTYVPRAERAGARVLAETRATEILHEGARARGVRATRAGLEIEIRAPIVCVAAGVLETPTLLMASGLSEGAGVGLQFHSSVHVTARFREPIHGYFGPTMAYAISEFADVLGHGGPGFMIENTTVHPLVTAQNLPGAGAEHERAMAALPHLAKAVVVLRDEARGTTQPGDIGPEYDYALTPHDLDRMAQGMRETARAYLAAGAEEVWLPVDGLAPITNEGDLDALEGRRWSQAELFSLYAVHLFGGAAMGGAPDQGFCDRHGESFAVEGLHVVDAAALPGNTGANPQITIMANA
ncbi:MAG: GMC family oxidoreductase, partial [Deltaproteobacteria bacterium]|nr:GMC family oxidoreductase [Deltaproteobacteria bacterium]